MLQSFIGSFWALSLVSFVSFLAFFALGSALGALAAAGAAGADAPALRTLAFDLGGSKDP